MPLGAAKVEACDEPEAFFYIKHLWNLAHDPAGTWRA
jgi:hypothetical protein